MKKLFNKEEIEILKKVETHFNTVINLQYKRNTSMAENNLIADMYEDVTGEKVNRNWGCATCCFNTWRQVGMLYYESVKEIEAVHAGIEPDSENQSVNDKAVKTKNKSRKKK